jgi:hypothetical protein
VAQAKQYRIVVRRELGELLSDALEPVRVERGDGQTILTTACIDECALYGMLDRLRDFNIELVCLAELPAGEHGGGDG